jgi:hypothetical protein
VYAIDFGTYVRPARASVRSAAVLAARLAKAAPADVTDDERAALDAVVARAEEVRAAHSERDRLRPVKTRPLLDAHNEAWTATYDALGALMRCRGSERGRRAGALRAVLFPDGIAFLRLSASSVWSESRRHLRRIEDESLGVELDALIGPEFLAQAKACTERLADAVGVSRGAPAVPNPSAITDALARFGRAVGAYARMMAAKVDETDERSAHRFLSALAPIDEHRAHARRRGARGEEKIAAPQADRAGVASAGSQNPRNDGVPPGPDESPAVRDFFRAAHNSPAEAPDKRVIKSAAPDVAAPMRPQTPNPVREREKTP